MVLRNAELDAEYRDLLERCLAEVGAHSEPIRPGMRTFEAFVILSSPAAVTPYHIDPEHNFLLQIRGKKRVTVFDRGLVADEQLERFFSGAHRNLPFDGSLDMHGQTFELPPGKGIHIPVTAPHHVVNGPGVSVSFSITFRTPDIGRRQDAFAFNAALRKTGLRPSPVGRSARRDALKSLTMRGWSKSRRVLGWRNAERLHLTRTRFWATGATQIGSPDLCGYHLDPPRASLLWRFLHRREFRRTSPPLPAQLARCLWIMSARSNAPALRLVSFRLPPSAE